MPTFDQFNQLFKFLGGGDSQTGKATKSMATYPIYIEDWVGDQETGGLKRLKLKLMATLSSMQKKVDLFMILALHQKEIAPTGGLHQPKAQI